MSKAHNPPIPTVPEARLRIARYLLSRALDRAYQGPALAADDPLADDIEHFLGAAGEIHEDPRTTTGCPEEAP